MSANQNEKTIIKTYLINGTGSVLLEDDSIRDVEIVGVILKGRWWFIVHRDVLEPQYLTVSEASSGVQLRKETYYEFEDALFYALPFLDQKYSYLHTSVMGFLTKTQINLLRRNLGSMTPALHTALWL